MKVTPPKESINADLPTGDMTIPPPADKVTMTYTKSEACGILNGCSKSSTPRRAKIMAKMIHLRWAPTTVRTFQKLMKKYEAGELVIDSPWSHTAGRPRAVTKSDIESLVTEFERGAAYDSSAVKKRLLSKRADLVCSSGGIPVVEDSLATTTVIKYICAVANHCGVSIVNKVTNKLRT